MPLTKSGVPTTAPAQALLERLTRARDEFLSGAEPEGVRPEILRSWRRSKLAGVPATGAVRPRLGPEVNPETLLLRAARPVAEGLARHLEDATVVVHVATKDAQLVGRWVRNPDLETELDRIGCLIGCIVEESSVGTTALGTVAEDRQPLAVWGAEHFSDMLTTLSAAGAPIVHPGTGAFQGVVSVGCELSVPSGLAIAVVTQAARAIAEGLLTGYSQEDRELLDAYLRIERRGPRRPVLAVNSRVLFTNQAASQATGSLTHTDLWEHVQRALAEGRSGVSIALPAADRTVELSLRTVSLGGEDVGVVAQIEADQVAPDQMASAAPVLLPEQRRALPGTDNPSGRLWRSLVDQVQGGLRRGSRLLLHGPPGSGKTFLAREALGSAGVTPEVIVDAASAVAVLRQHGQVDVQAAGRGPVILTRLDQVPSTDVDAVEAVLSDIESATGRPVICTIRTLASAEWPEAMAGLFDTVVRVPGLVERRDELPEVVARLLGVPLADLGLAIRPDALRALQSAGLPGNVAQLQRILLTARSKADDRPIELHHLPPPCRSAPTRRRLTPLERVERDAILAALAANEGNKLAAAKQLELSRSTFYRRLQALDLDR